MADVADLRPLTQEELAADLRGHFRMAIRTTLMALLEEELAELIGADRYERLAGRKGHRNGSYSRRLVTSVGEVEVDVPRSRQNGSAGGVIGRYKRRITDVDAAVTEAYVNGVSTRKMAAVTKALMGEKISRSSVSRVTKRLDAEVEALRAAQIEGPFPYLDATFLDARWARKVENVSALVAYGVSMDGHRTLLGVTIGAEESEDSWADLLTQLLNRGLSGVQLVIADAHRGIAAAVRRLLPEVKQQRCVVHLERNVLTKAPQRLRGRLAKEFSKVLAAPSRSEARKRLEALKAGLGKQVPEAIECFEAGFEAATVFYDFPEIHWRRIRSTNGLERLHGEIKRRIRAVGSFPDRASALRLIISVALRVTSIWTDRRYLDMSVFEKQEAKAA